MTATHEFIIGRSPSSSLVVPAEKEKVSGSHAKIIVDDSGEWELMDLGSGNGTYVKDANGDFKRIDRRKIKEYTVIRLGKEGHDSFTFTAHRVLDPDASYEYEFRSLRKLLKLQIKEEEALEERNARNMKIVKAASPIAMGLCILAQYAIPGMKDDVNLNLWLSRGAMALAPVVIGVFFGIDTRGAKALRKKRLKVLTCPKCGYPVSEFDIQNMQCSRCKAK